MSSTPPPAGPPPADWYPDPWRRFTFRYWDGSGWTEHVSANGGQQTDPVPSVPPPAVGGQPAGTDPGRIQQQVQHKAKLGPETVGGGGGTILTEPVLVVNQKAKLIEVNNEYAVFDQHGNQLGAVRQVGQSTAKKALRVLTSLDQFMTHRLQVHDMAGQVLLQLTRPGKVFKSTVVVSDAAGQEIGRIVQQNMVGKIRFSLESGGQAHGSINAENWRAWNFNIQDHAGTEVARITKTWEGLAKTMFTTADNYVVQLHRPLEEPLRSLVVASALSVDTALKQDSRGLG